MKITITITKVKQCDTPIRSEVIQLIKNLGYEYTFAENPDDTTITVFDPYAGMEPCR